MVVVATLIIHTNFSTSYQSHKNKFEQEQQQLQQEQQQRIIL